MISYKPFYATMERQGRTEYNLIFHQGIPSNTLFRMKEGKAITTTTIDTLCSILDCPVSDIVKYLPVDSPEALELQAEQRLREELKAKKKELLMQFKTLEEKNKKSKK